MGAIKFSVALIRFNLILSSRILQSEGFGHRKSFLICLLVLMPIGSIQYLFENLFPTSKQRPYSDQPINASCDIFQMGSDLQLISKEIVHH